MSRPLDGMRITVRIETPYGDFAKAVTPIDEKRELLDHYLDKFAEELWCDMQYTKENP